MHERTGDPMPVDLRREPPEIPPGWATVFVDFKALSRCRRVVSGMAIAPLPITDDEMERQFDRRGYDPEERDEVIAVWLALDEEHLKHEAEEARKRMPKEGRT